MFYHFQHSLITLSKKLFVISVVALIPVLVDADYKEIIEEGFWKNLYADGGKTFYCESHFDKASPILTVSHIYPPAWISKALECTSKRSCLRSNKQYQMILSDLHNMVPVKSIYHITLKNSIFGNLDESIEPNECHIKKRYNIVEPPDKLKGDVARIHFYMHKQYNLPLNSSFSFMKSWSKDDPPSKEEIERNNRIKAYQGNENPFISQPDLVDQLAF